MDKIRFFKILKNIQIYGYEKAFPKVKKEEGGKLFASNGSSTEDLTIDLGKFQIDISKEKGNTDYRFLVFNEDDKELRRYSILGAYLQGALLLKPDDPKNLHDESFTNYQKNNLKLLFGTFAFIDKDNNKLHYLLGSSKASIKQSFQLKTYYNIENHRGQNELMEIPPNIIKLLYEVNQKSRDNVESIENLDFYKIFNNPKYDGKRNEVIEKQRNIVYVSSGEIDHCILQWVFLNRKDKRNVEPQTDKFNFDFPAIYSEFNALFINNNLEIPYSKNEGKTLQEWLKDWGLVSTNRNKPTERFLASLEWFYFYLLKVKEDIKATYYDYRKYLDYIQDGQKTQGYIILSDKNRKAIDEYIEQFEGLFPYQNIHQNEAFSRSVDTDSRYINGFESLIAAYLRLILLTEEDAEIFRKRCRFNPEIHFLFRNCISEFYWHGTNDSLKPDLRDRYRFKEKTCRGLLYIPILNSPEISDSIPTKTNSNAGQVGYFIGHIKDSDSKGRNFFTHYRRQDGETDDYIGAYFDDEFYELNHVINTLGRIEREEVYLKKILKKHLEVEKEKFELQKKTSFSLTTHSFKTELKTTIIPQIGYVKKVKEKPEFIHSLDELNRMCHSLYNLSGIISLIDKIENPKNFQESGEKDGLLSKTKCEVNLNQSISIFNSINPHMSPIKIQNEESELPLLSITIHGVYFTENVLNLFCHTLFENLIAYAERVDNTIPIYINYTADTWEFKNPIKEEKKLIDKTKIRGNLHLFQILLEKSKWGELNIDSENYQFKLTLKIK